MPELLIPQPNAQSLANLEKIKKKIGEQLQQIPIDDLFKWKTPNGFSCDAAGNMAGLNLDKCQIADISFLKAFPRLTHLSLDNNQISDLSPLQTLTQLTHLWLEFNQISDISPLKFLIHLTDLWLRYNRISDLSPLQTLSKLNELRLYNNKIRDLTPLKTLTQLNRLGLSGNQISDLSPLKELTQLTGLYLWDNRISDLSPLKALIQKIEIIWGFDIDECLSIADNPLEIPPVEIVKQGTAAVRNYFQEIEKQTVLLLQSKLLLVGAGTVGKTSLMKKLKNPNFKVIQGMEKTTHGINIEPWDVTCTFADGNTAPVKIHSWDFGGQDIMYTTHQFFLTKRSLYLFVWDAVQEGRDAAAFDYWLNIIKLLSDNSPVIIVMNKSDVRSKHINEAQFKEKFPNIAGFLQVSCVTGFHIPELIDRIRECLCSMKHLEDKLPQAWMDIRDDLKKINKDYISLQEYFAVCKKRGLDPERAQFLGDYLHDLGFILHFSNDPLLENTVILNPEWATAAVYRIMDEKSILENKGRFLYGDLKTLWDNTIFPVEKHSQLLRLMERFELCFPVMTTDMHIVPELLPAEIPGLDFQKYKQPGVLHFEYHYEFMPRGILSRFISRLYYMICGDHFWESGVELTLEKTFALAVSEPLKRKLSISVIGPDKTELLAVARNHLDAIYRSLNMSRDIHYKEMIPCCCARCLGTRTPNLYERRVLKKYEDNNIETIRCQESLLEIQTGILLKGYAPHPTHKDLKELLPAIIKMASRLQGRAKAVRTGEDDRNSIIAEFLAIQGYLVKDQTRRGSSFSGKSMGELDMLIETPDNSDSSVIEAFNLKDLERSVIAKHFQKIFLYDASGLENNYLLVYAENGDFTALWQKYLEYVPTVELKYKLTSGPAEEKTKYADIKLARTIHNRHNRETSVYHIFINMRPAARAA